MTGSRPAAATGQDGQPRGVVLVIDDEEPVLEAVTDILAFAGVEVVTALNGQAGIELFRLRRDDIRLVLLDLSMPGLSGEETLRELYRLDPHVRVIVSTGFDQVDAADRIGRDIKVGFIQKPYDIHALVEAVMAGGLPGRP